MPWPLPAVADGGGLVTLKGRTGPSERGIVIHPVSSFGSATSTALLDQLRSQAENGILPLGVADVLPAAMAAETRRLVPSAQSCPRGSAGSRSIIRIRRTLPGNRPGARDLTRLRRVVSGGHSPASGAAERPRLTRILSEFRTALDSRCTRRARRSSCRAACEMPGRRPDYLAMAGPSASSWHGLLFDT